MVSTYLPSARLPIFKSVGCAVVGRDVQLHICCGGTFSREKYFVVALGLGASSSNSNSSSLPSEASVSRVNSGPLILMRYIGLCLHKLGSSPDRKSHLRFPCILHDDLQSYPRSYRPPPSKWSQHFWTVYCVTVKKKKNYRYPRNSQ